MYQETVLRLAQSDYLKLTIVLCDFTYKENPIMILKVMEKVKEIRDCLRMYSSWKYYM